MKRTLFSALNSVLLVMSLSVKAGSFFEIVPSLNSMYILERSSSVVTYTVTNTSPVPLNKLVVDTAPFSIDPVTDTCTGQGLDSGASCQFTMVVNGSNQTPSFILEPRVCAFGGYLCSKPDCDHRVIVFIVNRACGSAFPERAFVETKDPLVSDSGEIHTIDVASDLPSIQVTGLNFEIVNGAAVSLNGSRLYTDVSKSATDPGFLYVYNTCANPISLVAIIPGFDDPEGVAVSPDGSRVYVANQGNNLSRLSVIDTNLNAEIASIPIDNPTSNSSPTGVAVSPDGTKVYVAVTAAQKLTVIDAVHNQIIADIVLPPTHFPYMVAAAPDGKKVYVTTVPDQIYIIDTATNQISGSITSPLPNTVLFGVAVSPDGNKLYAALYNQDEIMAVNLRTGVITEITSPDFREPSGLSFSVDGSKLYVTNKLNSLVNVIDTSNDTIIRNVTIGPEAPVYGRFVG